MILSYTLVLQRDLIYAQWNTLPHVGYFTMDRLQLMEVIVKHVQIHQFLELMQVNAGKLKMLRPIKQQRLKLIPKHLSFVIKLDLKPQIALRPFPTLVGYLETRFNV